MRSGDIMALTFQWKEGARFNIDPNVAGREIERIRRLKGGSMVGEEIIPYAADPKNPLHCLFDWNDRSAAHRFRADLARKLVGCVIEVSPNPPQEERRAYVSVCIANPSSPNEFGPRFVRTKDALEDPELRQQIISGALSEFRVLRQKYSGLPELAIICQAIDAAFQKMSDAA
jgi:hypothetical protein